VNLYPVVTSLLGAYIQLALGYQESGRELVPAEGPLIVCANHTKWIDPFIVAKACPRQIYFMGKQELFVNPLGRLFFTSVGAFPVRRGEVDRAALRRSLEILKNGQVLGIFPEGTRSRTGRLGPGEPGAAVISLLTGTRIIPAGIKGLRPLTRVSITWGQPIDPAQFGGPEARRDRQAVRAYTEHIMDEIARLSGQVRGGPDAQ